MQAATPALFLKKHATRVPEPCRRAFRRLTRVNVQDDRSPDGDTLFGTAHYLRGISTPTFVPFTQLLTVTGGTGAFLLYHGTLTGLETSNRLDGSFRRRRLWPYWELAAALDKNFPVDTLLQRYWLPAIRAAIAFHRRKDPGRAIELLQVTNTIELGDYRFIVVYLRGEAYLMLHDGSHAATEFQKFIDHRTLVTNLEWGALARLGLARAYALQGDIPKAKAAYRDFLTLWKDADPDIPVLQQAKAEYVKLQ